MEYKIGLIGYGSIGKRHLKNLLVFLKSKNIKYKIDIIRNRYSKMQEDLEDINEVYYNYNDVKENYDVIFISNPTNLHYKTIKRFAKQTKHMFIEKPIFEDENYNIEELGLKEDGIYYIACPLRHMKIMKYLKEELTKKEKIISIRAICSSYLPEWRPNVDYKETYSAKARLGGGVSIDLIHEWDYIRYLFKEPKKVFNINGKYSNLEIDTDDLSIYIAQYEEFLLEIHLDYFGRVPRRKLEIYTNEDVIEVDIINKNIKYLKSGNEIDFKEDRDDYQMQEIKYFFDLVQGKEKYNMNDIKFALETLKIAKKGK